MNKKNKVKELVTILFEKSQEGMQKMIDKAINSSAIDIEQWDPKNNSMVLPKIILIAISKRIPANVEI